MVVGPREATEEVQSRRGTEGLTGKTVDGVTRQGWCRVRVGWCQW